MAHQNEKSILAQLIELRDKEVEAATHLFVVCGQPSTVEGFYDAWCKEDPEWFYQHESLERAIILMKRDWGLE